MVTETIPAGTMLAGVSTLPSAGVAGQQQSCAGTATVTVIAGGQTIVTFIDAAIPVVPTTRLRSGLQGCGCGGRSGYELYL